MKLTVSSCILAALSATLVAAERRMVGSMQLDGVPANSAVGRQLLQAARQLNNNNDGDAYDFVGSYSIKFQGCHHVQQWNDQVDEQDDVRIKTKRLARFRLCPTDSCSNDRSAGCTSKFGDYVVDLNTFVYNYWQGIDEMKSSICASAATDCTNSCSSSSDGDCMTNCYNAYDLPFCSDSYSSNINAEEYSYCTETDIKDAYKYGYGDDNNGDEKYYIGPFCADQGGEIHLGLFTDDTCTTYAKNGTALFYAVNGFALPYSDASLVSTRCLSCSDGNSNYNNGAGNALDMCKNIYSLSGKCETRMSVDYPNESSCGYIEGIKIIRADGVIRTSTTKKSKAAAVSIGLFSTLAVLLAGYVYYLRTKLGRAQINLAAASQPLT